MAEKFGNHKLGNLRVVTQEETLLVLKVLMV